MDSDYAIMYGDLSSWPTKEEMAAMFKKAGLNINVGNYAIRINDCSHFVFREFGGDMEKPCITADAESVEEMLKDTSLVSDVLAQNNIEHSFEVCDENDDLVQKFEFKHA